MRIVFFGASELGFKCCETLIQKGFDVVGIYTIPKKFNISYSKDKPVTNYLFKDFFYFKERYSIDVISIDGPINKHTDSLIKLKPDLIIVIGWYYMIPKQMRDIAPLGCIGIHASLLPKYRGGAPLVWAIINGEKEAGLTLFYFDDGVDSGDIIIQEKFIIEESDSINDVLIKVESIAINIICTGVTLIESGKVKPIVQDESMATYFPQRKPEDGLIDWDWDNQKIKNFIRAQTKPYPGAYFIVNNKKVFIWDADIIDQN